MVRGENVYNGENSPIIKKDVGLRDSVKDLYDEIELACNENIRRQKKLELMMHQIKGSLRLDDKSDESLRVESNNARFYSCDNFFPFELNELQYDDFESIIKFGKEHLREMDDPFVNGLLAMEDKNYAIFSFGEICDRSLLSRFLQRKMPMNEYLSCLSGEVPIVKYKGQKHFIERPCNYDSLLQNYEETHNCSLRKQSSLAKKITKLLF